MSSNESSATHEEGVHQAHMRIDSYIEQAISADHTDTDTVHALSRIMADEKKLRLYAQTERQLQEHAEELLHTTKTGAYLLRAMARHPLLVMRSMAEQMSGMKPYDPAEIFGINPVKRN